MTLSASMINASSCYFTVNNKVFTGSLTAALGSEVNCSYSLTSDKLADGTYTVVATGTDSSATADSTSDSGVSIQIESKSGAARSSAIAAGETQEGEPVGDGMSPGAKKALALAAVLGGGYYLIAVKKVKLGKLIKG